MMSSTPSATLGFVDRVEEMKRILDALKAARTGKGQLLIVRGEAGSGKTRLVQETAADAEKHGFSVGFGTALAESVVPYHAWKEALEGLGLDTILEEPPPPRLLGFYLLTPKGHIQTKVEREDIDSDLLSGSASMLADSVHDSKAHEVVEGGLTLMSQEGHNLLLHRGSTSHLGAIVEGREDEAFLADMTALADRAESILSGEDIQYEGEEPDQVIEAQMRQLLDSEIYEGIDYAKEDPKLRQNRLFELIALGLSRKAGSHPICVVIDDLQWADPSSLALLHYAARNTRKTGVLLLGTYRVEEAEARPHLRDALKGMEQEEILAEMDLNGLTREDLPDLAESFIGPHILSDAFLGHLWRETRGFPLFVREVLLGLEDDGEIVSRGVVKRLVCPLDEVALPERVRDVIRVRLSRLPREDRQLLDAAATCGTRFTAALVSRVAGEEEMKVLNGLSAIARVHGLLRPAASGFTFDHPAVQEVLYDGVPTEIRQTYHREAAEWLETAGGPIEDIGEHYYRARDSRAARKLRQAAAIASTKYANDEAARLLGEALELALPEERGELLKLRADALEAAAMYEDSLESYRKALDLTEEKYKTAEILGDIGWVCKLRGDYEEAIARCTQALNLVEGDGCTEESRALDILGSAYYFKGEQERAIEYYLGSMNIGERIGNQEVIANSLNNLANIYATRGDFDRCLEYYDKSLNISREIDDQLGIAKSLNNIGTVHFDRGDYETAAECHEKSLAIRQKIGDVHGIAYSFYNLADAHYGRGDFVTALESYEKSLAVSDRIGDQLMTAASSLGIGYIHNIRGDYDAALRCLERSLRIGEETGNRLLLVEVLLGIGDAHRGQGDYAEALESYMEGLELQREADMSLVQCEFYCAMAELHLEMTDWEKAVEFCNLALSSSTKIGRKKVMADSLRLLGMVDRERKKWKESMQNFTESLGLSTEIGGQLEAGKSHYEFGLMWKKKGEPSRAREHLDASIKIYEELNLKRDLERANAARESLQTKPPPKVQERQ